MSNWEKRLRSCCFHLVLFFPAGSAAGFTHGSQSRRGQRHDAERKEKRSNRTINPLVLVGVGESVCFVLVSPGAKRWKWGNVYLQRGGKKIIEVKKNLKKCSFENNPSVAENRRCRVESEAITSTLRPLVHNNALCLPASQLAGRCLRQQLTSSYLKWLQCHDHEPSMRRRRRSSPASLHGGKMHVRHRPIRSRFLERLKNHSGLWRGDELLNSSSVSEEQKKDISINKYELISVPLHMDVIRIRRVNTVSRKQLKTQQEEHGVTGQHNKTASQTSITSAAHQHGTKKQLYLHCWT